MLIGLIQREFFVEIICESESVTFGVGLRKLAVGVARAGDQSAANVRFLRVKADLAQSFARSLDIGIWDIRNDEILPDGQPNFAGAVKVGDFGDAKHLFWSDLADRNGNADVIKATLFLRINADVSVAASRQRSSIGWSERRSGTALQRVTEQFFSFSQILFQRPGFEQMLEARLLAVRAIAVGNENAHERNDDFVQLCRFDEDAEVAGKCLVAGRAAESDAEEDLAIGEDGFDTDVVGIFDRADQTTAIERNVEFAGQIVERAVIDDNLSEVLAEGQNIDQFMRINASRGICREIADIVRARTAGVQADALDAAQHFRSVFGLDEANLEIGARGDLDVAGGEFFGDASNFA